MKTIAKKINIYNFEELKEEIQEKLIEKEKENQEEIYCESFLHDDMKEKAIELLKENFGNKATFNKIYYDMSYTQGSGAMIEFDLYYYNKYVKIKQNGLYTHERSFTINSYELTEKQEKKLYNKIVEINKKLTKFGYDNIEYFWNMPKNEVINILSEYDFLENGEIYYN